MTEPAERILNGRYRITSLIGRGGMADVYLGHDLTLDRKVAVKMLRPDLARDPQFQGRFRREGQSSASLNHPNIVAVYDSGRAEVEDHAHHEVKTPYIVMEYVDGVTLRHILHGTPKITDTSDVDGEETRVSSASSTTPPPPPGAADEDVLSLGDTGRVHADGEHIPAQQVGSQLQYKIDHALNTPLSERETAGYMHGILGALGYSHDKGIVHRDIKPSNVMVSQTGQIKVMDFGIARALADSASTMTQTSAVVGTAQYLSPEQARGEVVDHRSDLYSAGCVLFELLTNRPPFQGESPVSVAYQHVREAPPLVSDFNNQVSPAMESVVGKALTKDPARRFQTAEEFNQAIQKALIGIGVDEDDHPTAALGAVGGRQDFNQVLAAGAAPIGTRLSARTPEDPDLYENHEVPERRPRRRRRGGLVLIWTLLILGLLGGGAYVLMNMLDTPESSIPEVEDLERAEAIEALDAANVSYSIETEPSTDIEEDHATRTDPGAGTVVTPEDSVVLYLSSGPDSVRVPTDLEDLSEDEARESLEEAGLEVGDVSEENDSSVEEGLVISTDPESGTSVSPGSEVNLVLSTGLVDMPGVFNRSLSDARSILENAGLSVNTIEDERTDYAAGTVVGQRLDGQSIRAGDPIPQGSQVTLVVAVAPPAPDPEPEEEPEPDPSQDESPDPEGEGEDNTEDEAGNDSEGGDNADSENSDSSNGDSGNGNNDDGNNGGNSNNGGGNSNSNGGNGGENANDAANGNNAP